MNTFRPAHALALLACSMLPTLPSQARADDAKFTPPSADAKGLRPLTPDRPSIGIGPTTIDAGHVQLETGLVESSTRGPSGDRSRSLTLGDANLRVGVLPNVELQAGVPLYVHRWHEIEGTRDIDASGLGDLGVRAKINLLGNDGGDTALALIPGARISTAGEELSNGDFAPALDIAASQALPLDFGLGLDLGAAYTNDAPGDARRFAFGLSVVLGHPIVGALSAYTEFYANRSVRENSDWTTILGGGLAYTVCEHLQVDGGANFGLSDAADGFSPFVGFTVRN